MSDKNKLAEDRTDWAEDRTILANERTFAAWIRTGMGALVVALALQAVFRDFEPTWLAKTVASVFVFAAVCIFWGAHYTATSTQTRLNGHNTTALSNRRMMFLSILFSFGDLCVGGILWLL